TAGAVGSRWNCWAAASCWICSHCRCVDRDCVWLLLVRVAAARVSLLLVRMGTNNGMLSDNTTTTSQQAMRGSSQVRSQSCHTNL
ncbi:hypothetical protein CICLE_v100270091mg, partial [Citrus x clementina]